MKCTGISVGNESPKDNRTIDQFVVSEQVRTPLGKLLIALIEEIGWSAKYTVYASFGEKPFLNIRHPIFLSDQSLMIYDDAKTVLSIRGVEDAVRALIRNSREGLGSSISILQSRRDDLDRASGEIMWDKAKAAIVAISPEAADAKPSHVGTETDLYAFSSDKNTGSIFVARAIDHEFIGGVARVDCNRFEWYKAGSGVENSPRHRLFWTALARAYVVRTLDVSEKSLRCEGVFVSEKPWDPLQSDPYIVEKVVFTFSGRDDDVIVEVKFGSDNLPERAFIQEEKPVAVAVKNVLFIL